jgi:signal transduction histidine kinase
MPSFPPPPLVRALNALLFAGLWIFLFPPAAPAQEAPPPARIVTAYALVSGQGTHLDDPAAWQLLGSNDGRSWTVLDVQKNQSFGVRLRQIFFIQNKTAYRIYRLQVEANGRQADRGVALAEIEFSGPLVGFPSEANVHAIVTSSQKDSASGWAWSAFDADITSKWVDYSPFKSGGCWIQCEYALQSKLQINNIQQLQTATAMMATRSLLSEKAQQISAGLSAPPGQSLRTLKAYALTSANDFPARDPRDWRLLGSNDGGKTWEILDLRRNEVFSTRFQRRVFPLAQPARYALYRLQVDAVSNAGATHVLQLADVEPLYLPDAARFSLVVSCSSENPPTEKIEMAFDQDTKTKWLAFKIGLRALYWIQWQSIPEIEDLPLINLQHLHERINRSPQQEETYQMGNVTRTLTAYSLVSASDRPARDPQDWRLLGSNDKGKTWDVLDVRQNETFATRLQKRFFTLKKSGAYALYRLQVNSVADPAEANSMQLAEIDPVYAPDPSSTPLTTVVWAEGDNPALEGVEKAFDGDPTTKWLDFSQNSRTRATWTQWYFAESKTGQNAVVRADAGSWAQPVMPQRLFVSLEGIALDTTPPFLAFLDGTGFQPFKLDPPPDARRPGDHIRLAGRLKFGKDFPLVEDGKITSLNPLPQAGNIFPKQIFPEKQPFAAGSVEGEVTALSETSAYTTLHLGTPEEGNILLVRILHSKKMLLQALVHSRIRARGVVEAVFDSGGRRIPGILWVSNLQDLTLVAPKEKEWTQWPELALDAGIRPPAGQVVHARGIVVEQSPGNRLVIQQGKRQLRIYTTQTNPLPPGSAVEVLGLLELEGSALVLRLAHARFAPKEIARESAPPTVAFDENNPVTQISKIEEILKIQPDQPFAVKIRGVITYIDPNLVEWYLQDGSHSIIVQNQAGSGLRPFAQQEGSYVELRGTVWGSRWIGIQPTALATILGKGRMPEALQHSWDYLMTGKDDTQWVKLEGIVVALENQRLTLNIKGRQVIATVNGMDAPSQGRLLGSYVRLSGVCLPVNNPQGRRLGIRLLMPSTEHIEIINASMENPFELSAQPISSLLQLQPGTANADSTLPLAKITGIVTYKEPRRLFLQEGTDGVRVVTREDVAIELGDRVEAVGLAEPDGIAPKLVQAIVRKVGQAPLPAARPVDLQAMYSEDNAAFHDAARGVMTAVFLNESVNESARVLELQEERTKKTFYAYFPASQGSLADIPRGSLVRLEGVPKAKTETVQDIGSVITSFEMYLNSPADVTVVKQPPWWTARHTLWTLAGLGLVLAIALLWAGLLRLQVRRRTRELQAEIVERKRMETQVEKTHKELVDISRQAGMAEVATSVLHNVGNVLNSVNVSCAVVSDKVRKSRISSITKTAELLKEQEGNLAAFFSTDPRGQKLPDFLRKLAAWLSEEQADLLEELHSLNQNVDHIKEIIATQQNYAKVAGVRETVPITALVNDALNLNEKAMAQQNMTVVREFEDVPLVSVEKHKVLQILVNLVRNAKHALEDSNRSDKQLVVRVTHQDGRVVVSIQDNGIGIAPENLTRIFSHGFTTKKDGHGFGLHSGILSAQEMGGNLHVKSDGLGTGATFILEIPVAPKKKG